MRDISQEATLLAIHSHLDAEPGDSSSRLILADMLADLGMDDDSRCQRWLAENRKWPALNTYGDHRSGWSWWKVSSRDHAVLPRHLHLFMSPGPWLFATRREAEEALAKALVAWRLHQRWGRVRPGDRLSVPTPFGFSHDVEVIRVLGDVVEVASGWDRSLKTMYSFGHLQAAGATVSPSWFPISPAGES